MTTHAIWKLCNGSSYQAGNISIRKDCKLGYLNQIPEYAKEASVMDVIQMAFEKIYELHTKMDELEHQLITSKDQELEKAILMYSKGFIKINRKNR